MLRSGMKIDKHLSYHVEKIVWIEDATVLIQGVTKQCYTLVQNNTRNFGRLINSSEVLLKIPR